MFSSTLQILLVESKDTKVMDPETGKPRQRHEARCILLADDGTTPVTVGRLRIPKALIDKCKVGTFRATFALVVPDFGDNKGDIVAQVTDLTPVGAGARAVQPKAA
ncbi:hypothetical protein [uncultured Hydrogenophaga sp.]|uniref:hypothetical protein n=1 Tax=uncultured Hydrogenophaga sp. TaxID=199683 RepID=UPI00258A72D6|nr:hypothetical protein [uncultured Hydrogenophaga sp.]